jgi:hypothetical protein
MLRAVPIIVVFLSVLAVIYALRGGYVLARYLPFSPIDLGEPGPPIVRDWKLAALRFDRDACLEALERANVDYEPVQDKPIIDGCGWSNAVRVTAVDGTALSPVTLSCPAAAALSTWVIRELEPAAKEHFGQEVRKVAHFGSYACRNIRAAGGLRANRRSEHATADAIDVSGFELGDGKKVSVLRDWDGVGPEANFLRAVHRGACRSFRVVLGPEANALHHNHFHFDRGWLWSCR